jgi:hypothetical protein
MKQSRTIVQGQPQPLLDDDPAGLVERVQPARNGGSGREAASETESAGTSRQPSPRIKTVSVQYGRKLNLGDFNSAEINVSIWADLDEDEDVQGALDMLYAQAKDNVKKQAMPLLKTEPISLNYRETFLGTPVDARKEK